MRILRSVFLSSTALTTGVFIAGFAHAADMPDEYFEPAPVVRPFVPVPSIVFGGNVCVSDGNTGGSGFASVGIPISGNVAAQLDGFLGVNGESSLFGGGAGHLYWRDHSVGLLGAYAGYQSGPGAKGFRLGGEAELYLDKVTLSGLAGWDFGRDSVFGQAKISAYVSGNTKIYGGYAYDGGHVGLAGVEHIFSSTNVAAFAEGRIGESDYKSLMAGLKFFGGGPVSSSGGLGGVAGVGVGVGLSQPSRTLAQRDREEIIPLWMQPCQEEPPPTETTIAI